MAMASESAGLRGSGQQGAEPTNERLGNRNEAPFVSEGTERLTGFEEIVKRVSTLQQTPTQEISDTLGIRGRRAWSIAKEFDPFAVKEKQSTPVDLLCGGCTLLAILVFFIAAACQTFITSKPSIDITETQATNSVQHPIPDVAITIGDDEPIIPLNESIFMKYVTPSFTYRTYERYHEFGKVKTYTPLAFKFGRSACGLKDKLQFQNPLVMCSMGNTPPYTAIEQIKATDERSRQFIGGRSTERNTTVDNPTIQGKYDEDVFSFLEIKMMLDLKNLSALKSDFFQDENGQRRQLKLNVWFRFDREAWDSSDQGLLPGEWDWFGFHRLPHPVPTSLEPARVGLDWNFWMKSNLAYVGQVHPIANFLHKEIAKSWLTYEGLEFDFVLDQWEEGSTVEFLEVGIKVGSQSRILNVTHPDLIDAMNFMGASYNIALFCGMSWAGFLTTLIAILCGSCGKDWSQILFEEKIDEGACDEVAISRDQVVADKESAIEESDSIIHRSSFPL